MQAPLLFSQKIEGSLDWKRRNWRRRQENTEIEWITGEAWLIRKDTLCILWIHCDNKFGIKLPTQTTGDTVSLIFKVMKTLDIEGDQLSWVCMQILQQGSGSELRGILQGYKHIMATNYTISGSLSSGLSWQ